MKTIVLGSRGSKLAMAQTRWVESLLRATRPGIETRIEVIKTTGDKIQDVPLAKVGGKGLFVKEIEEALLDGRCDLAVHSLKDVPDELPPGLGIHGILEREVPFDALVTMVPGVKSVADLREGAQVGTSSLRRSAQLLAARPDVRIVPLRGNVDTRLRKLEAGLDAILLAAAGLRRLGMGDRVCGLLEPPDFIPAVGQGVVAVECRDADKDVRSILEGLNHQDTWVAVEAERAFLHRVGGGCQVPMGAYARVRGDIVEMWAMIARPDGSEVHRHVAKAGQGDARALGTAIADVLLEAGGRRILDDLLEDAD